jgi:hypothetical protein
LGGCLLPCAYAGSIGTGKVNEFVAFVHFKKLSD